MPFDISSYANTMAQYNQWMNQQLYRAVATLEDRRRKQDCGLFFHSIHGTLNHLLLCDRMWLARFQGQPFRASGLDQELYAQFEALAEAREETDGVIIQWALGLDSETLPKRLHYRSLSAQTDRDMDYCLAVTHFFNHQTHHRGQITAALSRQGIDFGVTDLIFMPSAAVRDQVGRY
ncbi:MAG: DinB family protein [Pseudomonadota bacterium]|nr:DinB family protein [Pseudomonadota bacterium]